jgi:hypothetical protein
VVKPVGCSTEYYSVSLVRNDETLAPALPSLSKFNYTAKTLLIAPSSRLDAGTYSFSIVATDSLVPTLKATALWKILILDSPPVSINLGPPTFADPLADLQVALNTSLVYKLPSIQDPDGDTYSLTIANLGSVAAFTQWRGLQFIFTPTLKSQVGLYGISITLRDQNARPLSSKYLLRVEVTAPA